MKKLNSIFKTMKIKAIFFLFLLVVVACKKDDSTNGGDLIGQWEVIELKKPMGSLQSTDNPGVYILELQEDGNFTLQLDVNSCFGDYTYDNKDGTIDIEGAACTEACCDSDFAEDLVQLLPKMDSYSVSNETLELTGKGEIQLKKK